VLKLRWPAEDEGDDYFVSAGYLDGQPFLSCGRYEYEEWGEVYLTNEQAAQIALALLGVDNKPLV
jgi:hypothetical protein